MTRKKDKVADIAADFFGDEAEWLDDDSESIDKATLGPKPEKLPIAPPPPPPFAGGTVKPRDDGSKERTWAEQVSEAPTPARSTPDVSTPDLTALSRARTVVFSEIPTLPPVAVYDALGNVIDHDAETVDIMPEDFPRTTIIESHAITPGAPAAHGRRDLVVGDTADLVVGDTAGLVVGDTAGLVVGDTADLATGETVEVHRVASVAAAQSVISLSSSLTPDVDDLPEPMLGPDSMASEVSGLVGAVGSDVEARGGGDLLPSSDDVSRIIDSDLDGEDGNVVYGDTFEQAGHASVPMVRTKDPSPVRMRVPDADRGMTFTPPVARGVTPIAPVVGDGSWAHVVGALRAEAGAAEPADRAPLLEAAAAVAEHLVGDLDTAAALWESRRDLPAHGSDTADADRAIARALWRIASQRGDHGAAFLHAEEEAAASDGITASWALRRASAAHAALGDSAESVTRLEDAVIADADDVAAYSDLAAAHIGNAAKRVLALTALADRADGAWQSELLCEIAALRLALGELGLARMAFERAVEACPAWVEPRAGLIGLLTDLGEHAALAERLAAEAASASDDDAGFWWIKVGRAAMANGDAAQAAQAFRAAVAAGFPQARRELEAALARAGAVESLVALLAEQRDDAATLYRVGVLLEGQLNDHDGAITNYRAAFDADPGAAPAVEAAVRLHVARGEVVQARELLDHAATVGAESSRSLWQLRAGELAEALGDDAAAGDRFRAVLAAHPGRLLALEGLQRVLTRQAAYDALAALYAQRAEAASHPAERASYWYRAASVGPASTTSADAARAFYAAGLAAMPGHLPSLDGFCRLAEAAGDWRGLADALQAAATATELEVVRASLLYRAAQVYAARVDDVEAALSCARGCLALRPDFAAGQWLLRDLLARSGRRSELATSWQQQASELTGAAAAWARFAAAMQLTDHELTDHEPTDSEQTGDDLGDAYAAELDQVLAIDPAHVGALAARTSHALMLGDRSALVNALLQSGAGRATREGARSMLLLADLQLELGDRDAAEESLRSLAVLEANGRPLATAARLARQLGAWKLATELLAPVSAPSARVEYASIIGLEVHCYDEALAITGALLDASVTDAPVAGLARVVHARVAQRAEQPLEVARGLLAQASHASHARVRHALAVWAATAAPIAPADAAAATQGAAVAAWDVARAAVPDSPEALHGLIEAALNQRDASALAAFHQLAPVERAARLARVGDAPAALEALDGQAFVPALVAATLRERLLIDCGSWHAAYEAAVGGLALSTDLQARADNEGRQRWLLAEKLSDTDLAWDAYRALHERDPDDRVITEALAGIAASRGETALAIQYIHELASSAPGPVDAARYQRRIAKIHEQSGDMASARQAYLDALDYQPDDGEALAGLRAVAESEGDWQAIVQVLQREAGIATGDRKLAVRTEIATLTETNAGDPGLALDAWRAVLELDGRNREALEHLVDLAQRSSEWGALVEAGAGLAELLAGAERAELLTRLGDVCEAHLDRADAVRWWERAIEGPSPDTRAIDQLEAHYRTSADIDASLRVLAVRASAASTPEDRAQAWYRAALLERDTRHNRDAAAALFERVLTDSPGHPEALRFMANHLFDAGRYDDALPLFRRLEPSVTEGEDLDDFDTRMELSTYYYAYAEILRLSDDSDGAVARYEQALKLNPAHLASLDSVAPLYTEREDWKKAEQSYRQLLQLTGGQGERGRVATLYTRLGLVERQLGQADKAQKRFNKALEVSPNHVEALKGLALLLEDAGDWASLLNVYNNVIYHATLPGDVIEAYMTKGRVLDEHMVRPDKAAQHYQRSLDFDGNQPLAYLRLAELALRRDAYDEVRQLAGTGLPLAGQAPLRALLTFAKALGEHLGGHADDAALSLVEVAQLDAALAAQLGDNPWADVDAQRGRLRELLPK